MTRESWASSESARRTMRANRSRNTSPELALRSALHRSGLRFRINRRILPDASSADITFASARIAIFVDGCFWHGCESHCRLPKANSDYWTEKIARNRARDILTDRRLREAGWTVVRVWEHENPAEAAFRIRAILAPSASVGSADSAPQADT